MIKLKNPHIDSKEKLCFACSPYNKIGLQMEFYEDGEKIVSFWEPDKNYQGFKNVLHGGIQSTLIDEIAAWAVFIKGETAGVTKSIELKYLHPVYINKGPLKLEAKYQNNGKGIAEIEVNLLNHKNEISTSGKVVYFLYPPKLARKKLNYPGVEAYYK